MSADSPASCKLTGTPIEEIRELKRKACERISSLIRAISSNSSPKRSKASVDSFFTYKRLVKSYTTAMWRLVSLQINHENEFQFELWAGNEISPRELAVHGWECKARDQAQCIACKQFLCTTLPKITSVNISVYNRCLRRIRENIVNSHVLTCLYRSKPLEFKHDVDETFLNDIVRPKISTFNVEGLKMNMVVPDDLVWRTSETKCPESQEPFIGASLGWSIETEKIGGQKLYVAVCDYCARDFVLGYEVFDPVKTHKRWCPVMDVNPDDGVPLWKLILERVSPTTKQRTKPVTIKDVESAKRALDHSLSIVSRENMVDS